MYTRFVLKQTERVFDVFFLVFFIFYGRANYISGRLQDVFFTQFNSYCIHKHGSNACQNPILSTTSNGYIHFTFYAMTL